MAWVLKGKFTAVNQIGIVACRLAQGLPVSTGMKPIPSFRIILLLALCVLSCGVFASAQEVQPDVEVPASVVEEVAKPEAPVAAKPPTMDEKIDKFFADATGWFVNGIFSSFKIAGYDVLWVVLWLALAGIVFTLVFGFINIRAFPLALRTVKGKYSLESDPGSVTHFQALTAAVSGTVGLGNIAGVAIGIQSGGPGVAFWLFLSGFLGMSTKFAECTLGVKYRIFDTQKNVHGGPMYYLRLGLEERGLKPVGVVLALFFAIFCVFASFGGGNIFQVNQVTTQLINITGGKDSYFFENQWVFGLIMAFMTALVIIGGIKGIAKVTDKLVPLMCITYVLSCALVLIVNASHIFPAFQMIISEAFQPRAAITGGLLAAFIWGMRRATFSNEAGIGSAPIAHAAAKTRRPASEGVVALLEPFLDTVVICTMTALVLCVTMNFEGSDSANYEINGHAYVLGTSGTGFKEGIAMTSGAFETIHDSFKYVLFLCVFLFAFSTLITWSYYGLQAWQYLFGKKPVMAWVYKVIFCLIIVVGSSASMANATDFSDASLFAMSIPNLIGVYLLLPVVRSELARFVAFAKRVDDGATVEEADAVDRKHDS